MKLPSEIRRDARNARQVWLGMKNRCTNPKNPAFKNYGGRGIKLCERWRIFENFYEDMGSPPLGLSIDRINNDGNYEPVNCRWATWFQQANNRRKAKNPGRTKLPESQLRGRMVFVRVTEAQNLRWTKAAKPAPVSSWLREVANAAVEK